ncbi:kelch-like protein 7 isoform X2 [Fundulus heteroclitus]|uniref:kelch-like protein 7 isoform X2 n=1 Tax=Fundulus heteroclitus TaxID=8078 RepID=UPI00165CB8A4|nr:kelch-like protein 7 isoform X2 [Fundulus heteroclitus]
MASSTNYSTVRTRHSGPEAVQLSGLVTSMNEMRKWDALCDVTLVVKGRRFSAHRLVLAAGSELFRLMFTTNMMESASDEVELRGVDPEIVELLMDYIYTAQISITTRNVQPLLHAASQYRIEPVQKMCEDFLKESIDVTNCMGMWALAHYLYCEGLKAHAEVCVIKHFKESSMSIDFLELHVTCLSRILWNDNLSVPEEQIYEAALRWLNHDLPNRQQHLVEVLSCVRFPLLSKDVLSRIAQAEPLIMFSPQCLSMVTDAMHYHDNWKDLAVICRPRLKKCKHIAVFGHVQPEPCRYFNPKDSKWTTIRCSLEKRWNATAVYWNDEVYILGGSTCQGLVKRIDCYNTLHHRMHSKADLPSPRNKLAACVLQEKLYVSGGVAENHLPVDSFESFDTNTNSWQEETNLLTPRCCHGSVEVNGLIYVCGGLGMMDFGIVGTCEVYNPNTRQWRELCPMLMPRKNHGLVVVGNRIYAIGGKNGPLNSVEGYNINENYWYFCEPMPHPLMAKCVAIGETIYVLAGKGKGPLRRILKYNTRTDRWRICHKVQAVPYPGSVVCVVD